MADFSAQAPDRAVEEIKSRSNILDLIGARVDLKRTGSGYLGLCPFHQEKTPSFNVNVEKQFFKCFGCDAKGDIFEFMMRSEGLSFVETLERLAERYGVELSRHSRRSTKKDHAPLYELMKRVGEWYRQQLQKPEARSARAWLDSRGINAKIAGQFAIGYAPSGNRLLEAMGDEQQLLLQAGLIRKSERENSGQKGGDYYDFFRHRLLFPVADERGRLVAFGGRRLDDKKTAKYINSPETAIFSKKQTIYGLHQAMQAAPDELIVVEGYMDVIALAQFGWRNAVAVMGSSIGSDAARLLFTRARQHRLLLCLDGDEAGRRAAHSAVLEIAPKIQPSYELKLIFLPESEDPDSLLRTQGTEAFTRHLETALPLSEFLLSQIDREASPEQKSKALISVERVLRALPISPYRALVRKQVAEHSGLSESELGLDDAGDSAASRSNARRSSGPDIPPFEDGPDYEPDFDSPAPMDEPAESAPAAGAAKADTQEGMRRWDEQQAILHLLVCLRRCPALVDEVEVPVELQRPQLSENVTCACRLIDALRGQQGEPSKRWNLMQGQLMGQGQWQENWDGLLKQADVLDADLKWTSAECRRRVENALQRWALNYSEDHLQTQMRIWRQGNLLGEEKKRAKGSLLKRLESERLKLAAKGQELPSDCVEMLQELKKKDGR